MAFRVITAWKWLGFGSYQRAPYSDVLIWDTAALRGAHQAPVSCLACCWSQMWPEIVPARCSSGRDEQTLHPCASEMMGWAKCPDVTWQICGSCLLNPRWTHGYFLSRHLACQVMWMSCGLTLTCHCAQSPAVSLLTAYSTQVRPPACASSLPKVPGQLWEKSSLAQQLRNQVPGDLCAGMCQFNTRKKTQTNSPKCSGDSCVDEFCSADDWCVSWRLQFCLHLKNLEFCTEDEFA